MSVKKGVGVRGDPDYPIWGYGGLSMFPPTLTRLSQAALACAFVGPVRLRRNPDTFLGRTPINPREADYIT